MKYYILLVFWFFGFAVSLLTFSCKAKKNFNDPDSLSVSIMNRKTKFNPEYFKDEANYHFLVGFKYENGNYRLQDNHIYKIPGNYRDISNFGSLVIRFLNSSNVTIDSLITSPPNLFVRENRDSSSLVVDTILFSLPVRANSNIVKVQFWEKNINKGLFIIPKDTIDIIERNKTVPLDSALFL